MDYSLLVAIETLDKRLSMKIHRIGAPRVSFMTQSRPAFLTNQQAASLDGDIGDQESFENKLPDEAMLVTDVGELMSRKHCFVNGKRVYHFAIIDYLQEWNF